MFPEEFFTPEQLAAMEGEAEFNAIFDYCQTESFFFVGEQEAFEETLYGPWKPVLLSDELPF